MIVGVGIDIVNISRIKVTDQFINKILTDQEKQLLKQKKNIEQKKTFIAGRFAAKEAIAKALGTGLGDYVYVDFNVVYSSTKQPVCKLENYNIHLSISHDGGFAVATAVVEQL